MAADCDKPLSPEDSIFDDINSITSLAPDSKALHGCVLGGTHPGHEAARARDTRGDLDRLARSAARLSRRSMILSLIEGGGVPDVRCRRIGAPLLFERLWRDSGCRVMVEELLAGRRFEFAVWSAAHAPCSRCDRRVRPNFDTQEAEKINRMRGGWPLLSIVSDL
jgi:hypothetical protein